MKSADELQEYADLLVDEWMFTLGEITTSYPRQRLASLHATKAVAREHHGLFVKPPDLTVWVRH